MTAFRVMTWNVENLFAPPPGSTPDELATFGHKLRSLATLIDEVQPHVLALQEVGDDNVLSRLQDALVHPMPHAVTGMPGSRGIRVAFLSVLPFDSTRPLQAFPDKIRPVQLKDPIFDDPATPQDESLTAQAGRGALEVTVSVAGTPVTVITAHFKSKLITYARKDGVVEGNQFQPNDEGERYRYGAYALYLRSGEAMTIRQRLNEILTDPNLNNREGTGRNTRVVFCGDLNDEVEAATTQIIQGPSGSEIGTRGFQIGDKDDGFRMWNLAPILPSVGGSSAFTRIHKGRGELIDHIFASHALVNPQHMPSALTRMATEQLPSISDNPNIRLGEPGSDHAAVVATFEV